MKNQNRASKKALQKNAGKQIESSASVEEKPGSKSKSAKDTQTLIEKLRDRIVQLVEATRSVGMGFDALNRLLRQSGYLFTDEDLQAHIDYLSGHGLILLKNLDRSVVRLFWKKPESEAKPVKDNEKPWLIFPLIPGRFSQYLNQRQTCAVIALAIHNNRRALETVIADFLDTKMVFEAAGLADTLAIASAVVRSEVLACLSEGQPGDVLHVANTGLTQSPLIAREEALLEMVGSLHRNSESIRAREGLFGSAAWVELSEAILIAEEAFAKYGKGDERVIGGRGENEQNPTGRQDDAWLAKIAAVVGSPLKAAA